MSTIAYLTLTGAKQGVIKGGVTAKGREGTIMMTAVSHKITTPVDQVTGAASGKRRHEPITIAMVIDRATPKLYQAAVTNEVLTSAKIGFWQPSTDGSGTEVQYFTIALINALIIDISLNAHERRDPDSPKDFDYEEVQFTYQKIEWTWVDGGVTSSDTWEAVV